MRLPLLLPACTLTLFVLFQAGCKKTLDLPPCTEPVEPRELKDVFKLRDVTVPCTDKYGNPIEDDNLIIHFPSGMSAANIQDILNKYRPTEVDSCLCDPKLQNWRWADSLEIHIEETVSQMTQQSKREGTGWSAQLNYIVNSFDPVERQEKKDTVPEKTEAPLQKGKIIAILDSGLDLFYEARGRITLYTETSDGCAPSGSQGWNFVDDNNNIQDNNGHGTSVAGAIVESLMKAASSEEYTCGAQFLILKTLDANGVGNIFDAMCAVQYAVKAEAEIINMSWGFYNADNEFFRDSILTLSFKDNVHPVFVTSMGNLGLNNADTTKHYPSAYGFGGEMNYIIGVGSDARNDIWGKVADVHATPSKLAPFSNFDTSDVMVTAPGDKIRTWARLDGGLARYHLVSGTSYSAALVTAAVAVTQCCDPAATAIKVEDRLRGSGVREMNTAAGLNVTQRNVVMESDSLCNR